MGRLSDDIEITVDAGDVVELIVEAVEPPELSVDTSSVELSIVAPPILELSIDDALTNDISVSVPPVFELSLDTPDVIQINVNGGASECRVPPGGATGQHLGKSSDTDFDVEWVTPETGGGGTQYIHNQIVLSPTWIIEHNMNKHPEITCEDGAGSVINGSITYLDNNTALVGFAFSITGRANCT